MIPSRTPPSQFPSLQKTAASTSVSQKPAKDDQSTQELEILAQLHATAATSIANREALQSRNRSLLQNMQVLE